MKPALQLKLSQHLALTPQLQQSIKLLQLSTVEMQQEIENYLLENPMLERDDDGAADSFAAAQQFDAPRSDAAERADHDERDPMLKAFAAWAKKKYNVDVKTSAIPKGTPVAYGQILEWKGRPQADVFWGGEGTLFDQLAIEGLLEPVQLPQAAWDAIPANIGKPVPLPLKDPKKFWVGTTLEPYGIIYQPKLLKRLGVEIKTWDDLLNPKLKGQIAQCTPDRSSSSHASYEVILQTHGWEKGWEWLTKLAANTGIFSARSRDVPSVVAKGEFAVGFAVPSYMAFAERLAEKSTAAPPTGG